MTCSTRVRRGNEARRTNLRPPFAFYKIRDCFFESSVLRGGRRRRSPDGAGTSKQASPQIYTGEFEALVTPHCNSSMIYDGFTVRLDRQVYYLLTALAPRRNYRGDSSNGLPETPKPTPACWRGQGRRQIDELTAVENSFFYRKIHQKVPRFRRQIVLLTPSPCRCARRASQIDGRTQLGTLAPPMDPSGKVLKFGDGPKVKIFHRSYQRHTTVVPATWPLEWDPRDPNSNAGVQDRPEDPLDERFIHHQGLNQGPPKRPSRTPR